MCFARHITGTCIKSTCIFFSKNGNNNSIDIKGVDNYKERIYRKKKMQSMYSVHINSISLKEIVRFPSYNLISIFTLMWQ